MIDRAPDQACDNVIRQECLNTELYVGTKIVKAEPMTFDEFKKFKGQEIGLEENAQGYKVTYEDGYVSWSPKRVFEQCYRLLSNAEIRMAKNVLL
jgi:hypothetical protein